MTIWDFTVHVHRHENEEGPERVSGSIEWDKDDYRGAMDAILKAHEGDGVLAVFILRAIPRLPLDPATQTAIV